MRNLLSNPDLIWATLDGKFPAWIAQSGNAGLYFLAEPELSNRLCRLRCANHLAQCDLPRALRTPIRNGLFEPNASLPLEARQLRPEDMETFNFRKSGACWVWGDTISDALDAVDRERARQAGLEVALALQIYVREQGEFPESLAAIISPDFPSLPDDPFAKPATSLRYQHQGLQPRLWSIGPDGVDGGGIWNDTAAPLRGDLITPVSTPEVRTPND